MYAKRERTSSTTIRLKYSRYSRHLMLCFASSHFIISFLAHVVCIFFMLHSSVWFVSGTESTTSLTFTTGKKIIFSFSLLMISLDNSSSRTNKLELERRLQLVWLSIDDIYFACRKNRSSKSRKNEQFSHIEHDISTSRICSHQSWIIHIVQRLDCLHNSIWNIFFSFPRIFFDSNRL